jgi:small-conductance mechanosensitive channel
MRRAARGCAAALLSLCIAVMLAGPGGLATATQAQAQVKTAPKAGGAAAGQSSAAARRGGATSGTAGAAAGANGASGAAALSTKDLQALIKTLEDKGKRDEFLGTLKALLKARQAAEGEKKEGAAGFLSGVSARAKAAANQIVAAASAVLKTGTFLRWIGTQWADPLKREKWKLGFLIGLAILAIGLAAEWIARFVLRSPRAKVEAQVSDAWPIRLLYLAARTLLDLLPIGAFAAAAYSALPLFDPPDAVRLIALTIIYASVLSRSIKAVARMILVPKAEGLRLVPMETGNARYLMVWIRRFTTVAVYGYFIAEAALLFGLPASGHAVLMKLLGLALTIMAIIFIVQNRRIVGDWLRDKKAEKEDKGFANIRARFADVWHILASLYVIGTFLVWALDVDGGFEFVAALLLVRGLDRGVERLFRVGEEMAAGAPGLEARANRYVPFIHKAIRVIVTIIAGLSILQAWGVDTIAWLTGSTGERFVGSLVTIFVVLVMSLILWELISSGIERYLENLKTGTHDAERIKRLSTLLPLARNAILVALIIFVTLIVLSELGINIGPLLAGAGVVGLAIGFGAQTLVKDIITGLFILVEDTIQVGDVVEADSRTGVVEGLSIRTLRLRDINGSVHTIPFSSVGSVKNLTKEFAYYLFEVGVAYREDTDEVISVLREIDEDLRADPDYKHLILEPLDIWGVDRFADSAVIVRARYKTRPGNQWAVGRAFNGRMKKAFDALGIEIPFPHVTLYYGEGKDGTAPPMLVRHEEGLPKPKRKPAAKPPAAADVAEQAAEETRPKSPRSAAGKAQERSKLSGDAD